MNFRSKSGSKGIAALEITPLVDIVFLLLIFFLLTATYVQNPNLDISLPKASVDQTTNHQKDFTIAIKENGELRYNNVVVSLERLEGILTSEYAQGEDSVVVVRADEGARHGRVVEVMDLAKRIGFGKLAIAIKARTPSSEVE